MRQFRSSGSVEGVVSNHDPYSDCLSMTRELFSLAPPLSMAMLARC